MLYELRVYHATPGRLPDVLKRFELTTVRLFEEAMRHGQVNPSCHSFGPRCL